MYFVIGKGYLFDDFFYCTTFTLVNPGKRNQGKSLNS